MTAQGDPRPEEAVELATLAAGLRVALRRRRWLGRRRTGAAPQDESPTPAPPASARPSSARAPASERPAAARPRPAFGAAGAPAGERERPKPAAAPGRAAPEPPGADEVEAAAKDVRERAAACADLDALRAAVAGCTSCGLCETRTRTVFADGTGARRVLFVGEAPGFHEDEQGVPFVGRAGQLLTDIIEKGMGLARSEVFIANVLKCRPPENRDPTQAEKRTCTPWLDRQIELVDPEVIIPLGRHAANHVLGIDPARALSMGRLRGEVRERADGRKVVATYHPAYLLRSPGQKKECWKDIQLAMGLLGLEGPGQGR